VLVAYPRLAPLPHHHHHHHHHDVIVQSKVSARPARGSSLGFLINLGGPVGRTAQQKPYKSSFSSAAGPETLVLKPWS
jgi:hypothetical protein